MGPLDNKTILFSGVFAGHERGDLEKQAVAAGAKLLSGVSKNLNYLVADDKMGPQKKDKADELGIPIITLQDFFDMVGGPAQAVTNGEVEPIPKIESIYIGYTIYKHTIMDSHTVYIAERSKKKTPHIFAPPVKDVFVNFDKRFKEKILPLFTLDLHALNPAYTGLVHFIYNESVNQDWVIYRLDKDSKITTIQMMSHDVVSNIDDKAVRPFEESYEYTRETLDEDRKENGKYIAIKTVPMPVESLKLGEIFKGGNEEEYKRYRDGVDRLRTGWDSNQIGPHNYNIQNGFSYPKLSGSDTPFLFVGQLTTSSSVFGDLIDTEIYLYYHPETKIVAQFMQMT